MLYNLFNYRQLQPLQILYRQYGVKKSVFLPIDSSAFKDLPIPHSPWLDTLKDKENILQHPVFQQFSADLQQSILDFPQKGYLIWKNAITPQQADAINAEMEQKLHSGDADFNYTGKKVMMAHRVSPAANQAFKSPQLLHLLEFLLGRNVLPFQTIYFREGSRQKAHSDAIHMSTFPEGYLIAAWIALEDIDQNAGPLFYYPGSHRSPYASNHQFLEKQHPLLLGKNVNATYEQWVEKNIRENHWHAETFLAKKGDILIWHANLLHGGSPVLDAQLTRKSLVAHYYADGVICYHEISQRPAIIEKD